MAVVLRVQVRVKVDDLCVGGPVWERGSFRARYELSFTVSLSTYSDFLQGLSGTHTYVYYQCLLPIIITRKPRSHTVDSLSSRIITSHRALSELHCLSFLTRVWTGTRLNRGPALMLACPVDDNSRMDENETSIVSLRTTDATPGLGPSLCVYPVPPDLPPFPPNALSAQPPGRWVSLGAYGEWGGRGWAEVVGKLAGVTQQDYFRPTRVPVFNGNTRSSQVFGVACCLPACLIACLPACPTCYPCPLPPRSYAHPISWNSRLAVGSRAGGVRGEGGSQWAGNIQSDGGVRGTPQEAWSW